MGKLMNGKNLVLGVCYYPEHWPQELWREDLLRMKENGITVVRIGEFAWSIVEKTEGEFDYCFFDSFLDLAEEVGMQVIFGTPTATPPAWLTEKYPEVLNANIEGTLYRHGARRHYNYNSKKYQELSARIVTKFAEHYAKRSCVIGWQIDNEINCELAVFYSQSDTLAFRTFLKEKYQTLDALNAAWGTVFWNQTYTAWEEIFVPRKTIGVAVNPHQVLDYTRFISESARRFVHMQSEIVRSYIKEDDFITTNGIFNNVDNHKMTEESLDFLTYDSYPNFAFCLDAYKSEDKGLRDRNWSRNLAEVRSASPAFGIMEQQSGANGWNTHMEAPTPRPGQLTLWTMQSIGHGADFVSYFRWRTCTFGTEIYWHGILDYSGRENRRLREVRQVYSHLQKMQEIAGAKYQAQVGIIRDYDNIWDAQLDVWHNRVEWQSQMALFDACQVSHTPFDYLYLDTEREGLLEQMQTYKVLFYPHATILTKAQAELLSAYVQAGGILVFGCRSAYKDEHGHCVMEKLPGVLAKLTGADVLEYSFIPPDTPEIEIDWNGKILKASVFIDELCADGDEAKLEASYSSEYFAGQGALVSNAYGKGKVYYYGTAWNRESALVFLEQLGVCNPYAALLELPEDCELCVREKNGKNYYFILNYSSEERTIELHESLKNMYTDEKVSGTYKMKGYETLVLTEDSESM